MPSPKHRELFSEMGTLAVALASLCTGLYSGATSYIQDAKLAEYAKGHELSPSQREYRPPVQLPRQGQLVWMPPGSMYKDYAQYVDAYSAFGVVRLREPRARSKAFEITELVSLRLSCYPEDAFKIELLSSSEQRIVKEETRWRWRVTAKKEGFAQLLLSSYTYYPSSLGKSVSDGPTDAAVVYIDADEEKSLVVSEAEGFGVKVAESFRNASILGLVGSVSLGLGWIRARILIIAKKRREKKDTKKQKRDLKIT